jgi:gluconolactonase
MLRRGVSGRDRVQQVITQKPSAFFQDAGSEAARYLEGTLPNGLAFATNGDFLISNFGTDCLEVMSRDGTTRVLAGAIEGQPVAKSISCAGAGSPDGALEREIGT